MEHLNFIPTPYIGIYSAQHKEKYGAQTAYFLRNLRTGAMLETPYYCIEQAQSAQRDMENNPEFKERDPDFELVANLDVTAALIDEIEALDEMIKHPFLNGLKPISVPFRPFTVEWDGTLKEVQRDGLPVLVGGLKIV